MLGAPVSAAIRKSAEFKRKSKLKHKTPASSVQSKASKIEIGGHNIINDDDSDMEEDDLLLDDEGEDDVPELMITQPNSAKDKEIKKTTTSLSLIRGATVMFANKVEENVQKIDKWDLPYQQKVKDFYNSSTVMISVALLIFLNFICSAAKAEIDPTDSGENVIFLAIEIFFAVVFTIELVINIYGHWLVEFFTSGWNWFDFIIVIISDLSLWDLLPRISVLRLFRAFRVFRLFKRVESLRRIVEAVLKSLPSVANAFCVLFLIMAIWAIMGVDFYAGSKDGNFDTFFKALFTMIQCMTLDAWASEIASELVLGDGEKSNNLNWLFFVSYILIAGIVLVNVVVAVLLENFIGSGDADATADAEAEAELEKAYLAEPPPDLLINLERDVAHLSSLVDQIMDKLGIEVPSATTTSRSEISSSIITEGCAVSPQKSKLEDIARCEGLDGEKVSNSPTQDDN